MTLQAAPSLLASTVLTGQGQVNESALANTTAGLATGNASTETLFGINQSAITVNSPGSVVGTVVAGLTGTAISVSSNADADAGSVTGSTLVGIEGNGSTGFVSIGGTGSVQGSLLANLTAAGTSTDSNGDASAGIFNAIGISSGDTSINGDGTVAGLALVNQSATARSTAGASNADAQVENLFGLTTGATAPSLQIAGTGALYGAASLVSTATASTTGDDAAVDTANATQRVGLGIGLDLNGSAASATATTIGGAAAITGQVEVVGTANASATTGNSSAVSNAGNLIGLRPSDSAPLQTNAAGVVTATASGVLSARSTTTSGESNATAEASNVSGVNSELGSIAIAANGVINASALLDTTAVATTIDGLGNNATARANPNFPTVFGISLGGNGSVGLTINGSSSISGTAQMNQVASATTVSNGNATAYITNGSAEVMGIDETVIDIQGASTGFIAGSTVTANANSASVSGNATSESVLIEAKGLRNSSVAIGGSSSGNLRATARLSETFASSSVSGNASTNTDGSIIHGFSNSDLAVAGSANTVITSGELVLTETAQSTSGGSALVSQPTSAYKTSGISSGNISIGSSGSIESYATSNLNLKSLNVTGNAEAYFASGTVGTDFLSANNSLKISGSGNISSISNSDGSVQATSTYGPAHAGSTQDDSIASIGILSQATGSELSVAGTGNITGKSNVGSLSTPFTITSSSVGGSSEALLDVTSGSSNNARSNGIEGQLPTSLADATLLHSSAGNIKGISTNNIQFNAISINGNSLAGITDRNDISNRFTSYGLKNSLVIIDSTTQSQAEGSTNSTFTATSKSVGGNADSRLELESAGLYTGNGLNTIQASNTLGQSQISAVSLASTVSGTAVASNLRSTNSLAGLSGIENYGLTSIGAGSILADSEILFRSSANSVSGSATGISTL